MDVASCSMGILGIPSRVDELIRLSDLSQQEWFRELERLRQYKHVWHRRCLVDSRVCRNQNGGE